jgi:hypothetical protein
MSYRRGWSYRGGAARPYRSRDNSPRAHPAPMIGFLAVVVVAALAIVIAPHVGSLLDASSTTPGRVGACVTPVPTASASPLPGASGVPVPCPSPTQPAPPPVVNANCEIIVPAYPLTAAGLATPYQLTGPDGASPEASGCTEANSVSLGAFVQATILDPATGALSVYEPLVITKGTRTAVRPVVPTLPNHAIVTIDFGFNGTDLTQVGATRRALQQGHCTDGLYGSVFGQVSFCNGTAFFQAAFRDEARGKLVVPSAGVSPLTHQPCPTTRNFNLVDQDPSDNVTTRYLLTPTGQTAQFNRANAAALRGATEIVNGSDNALLDAFIDPTLGCEPFKAPDLTQGGTPSTSQALNELSAARSQAPPVALVPENDEMVLVNNAFSVAKTNLYRSNVGQPAISAANNAVNRPAEFCQNISNIQTLFLSADRALLATGATPVPSIGDNLLTFMANRLSQSFVNLSCHDYGLKNPVRLTLNSEGAATAATFDTRHQTANRGGCSRSPHPWRCRHHHWHRRAGAG